jgi:hypothetical protein
VNGRFTPVAMERYYLELVRRLGCPDLGTNVELFLEPEAERECDARFAAARLERGRPLVCLAPGAGFGPSKLWPLEYVAEVAAALRRDGAQVALVHGPGEQALADRIAATAGPGIASLGGDGMSLSLLKSVLARAAPDLQRRRRAAHRRRLRATHDRADGPDGGGLHQSEPEAHQAHARAGGVLAVPAQGLPDRPPLHDATGAVARARRGPRGAVASGLAGLGRAGARDVNEASVDLSIVIVAWNVRDLVLDCLASIADAKLGLTYEVIVVDNGSADFTVEAVSRQFPDTRIVALPKNIGFGAGNNRGLEVMRGRVAVLLNSDTIVLPGTEARRFSTARRGRGRSAALNRPQQNWTTTRRRSSPRSPLPLRYPAGARPARMHYDAPIEVEAVLGACSRGEKSSSRALIR